MNRINAGLALAKIDLSDVALFAFIFTTITMPEGSLLNVAAKGFLLIVTVFGFLSKKKIIINSYLIVAIIFVGLSVFSIKWSLVPAASVSRSITLTLQLVCYFCIFNLLCGSHSKVLKCLNYFVFSTFCSCIWTFLVKGVTFQDNRTSDGSVTSGQLAFTIAFSIMICFFEYKSCRKKSFLFMTLVLFAFLILTSGKRGLVLSVCFVLCYQLCISKNLQDKLYYIIGSFVGLVTLYILITKVSFIYSFIGYRVEAFLNYIFFNGTGDASTRGRSWLIDYGMSLFAQSPIKGNGIGTFTPLFQNLHGSWSTSADNNYVELLSDLGILGFLTYYIPFYFLLLKTMNNIFQKDQYVKFAFCGLLSCAMIDYASVWFFSKCGMLMIVFFYQILHSNNGSKHKIFNQKRIS